MKSLILVAAFLYAASAPLPRRVRIYFWAEIVGAIAMEGLLLCGCSANSSAYSIVYSVATLIIIGASFYIGQEAMRVYSALNRALIAFGSASSGIFFSVALWYAIRMEYPAASAGQTYYYLTLTESALLWTIGGMMAVTAPLLKGRDRVLSSILAIVWITKAVILYWYTYGVLADRKFWLHLGAYLPAILFVVACFYLGRAMRQMEKGNRLIAHSP